MSDPKIQLREALTVLNNYYGVLANHVADEIIAHKEVFESGGLEQAEAIIDKYARHASRVNILYGILRWEAWIEKPEGKGPLAANEFRCFGCGEVIQADDKACKLCGWSWRNDS